MLKISKLADYACSVMRYFAVNIECAPSATVIAQNIGIALPTVRKILKQLQLAGLLSSTRGKEGGYQLATELSQISLADVVEAIDGPIALTTCCDLSGRCHRQSVCHVKQDWQSINQVVYQCLSSMRLDGSIKK